MSMADWSSLLGLPLDKAVEIAHAWGGEPKVLVTCAPGRKGEESAEARQGTMRVIRARELKSPEGWELTVSMFRDGDPRKE